jgi:hypothetical protein
LDETAILKAYEALIAEDGRWVNLAPRLWCMLDNRITTCMQGSPQHCVHRAHWCWQEYAGWTDLVPHCKCSKWILT